MYLLRFMKHNCSQSSNLYTFNLFSILEPRYSLCELIEFIKHCPNLLFAFVFIGISSDFQSS